MKRILFGESWYFCVTPHLLLLCAMDDIVCDVVCLLISSCETERLKELKLEMTGCLDSGLL